MKLHKYLFILFLSAFTLSAVAQTESQLRRKKEAIQREIEQLQKNLNKAASGKKLTIQQINTINAQIRLRQDKIGTINSEIKNLDNQISQNTNTVHTLQGQLGDLKKEYAGMIRFAQRNRNAYDKMMFIFAAKDFNQAYKRIKYLQQFSQYRKKQAGYIENTQQDLNGKIKVLDKTLREKSDLLKEQERERERLGKDKSEQSVVLNKLSKQEKQFKQDINTRVKQQAQIDKAIRVVIQRAIEEARRKAAEEARIAAAKAAAEAKAAAAKARAENKPVPAAPAAAKEKNTNELLTNDAGSAKLAAGFENNRGRLPYPVSGTITEHFGVHKVDQASMNNEGVNITASEGAAVRAVFDGEVLGVSLIYGKYVVILMHGNYFTIYQNLRSASVSKGDKVSTRQTIGVLANTGDIAELHFEIMRGQTKLNPEAWISK
ncbi:peptidoglycan DD-metalloendopeptidase family protein [Pedobacter sp. HDW13]|uniref:murein hydrolase activator EnvC family protein n=1 Tax=unclassified Pedobacter TaxID=2628915 RepID=UPI000F5B2A3E|nr:MULTISPECIES: peptidoglycan DD-metalloendopeptidase family protein [unclassified Pedobacter]QIL39174.1 peptidoglycan DD-metalloendopeptidase family protein [Pedobacter sp. HDW13]RQO69354.1 peptidase M23 [Pedobacter sp. KBW01]